MNEYPDWLKAIFPYEQKRVVVNGRAMSYVDVGPTDAQPILLLPGNPTWGFLYREFFGPLTEAGFRVVSPDWVGSGYSDHPRLDASLTFAHLGGFIGGWIASRLLVSGADRGDSRTVILLALALLALTALAFAFSIYHNWRLLIPG